MRELIETLNETPGARVALYGLILIALTFLVGMTLVDITRAIVSAFRKK